MPQKGAYSNFFLQKIYVTNECKNIKMSWIKRKSLKQLKKSHEKNPGPFSIFFRFAFPGFSWHILLIFLGTKNMKKRARNWHDFFIIFFAWFLDNKRTTKNTGKKDEKNFFASFFFTNFPIFFLVQKNRESWKILPKKMGKSKVKNEKKGQKFAYFFSKGFWLFEVFYDKIFTIKFTIKFFLRFFNKNIFSLFREHGLSQRRFLQIQQFQIA